MFFMKKSLISVHLRLIHHSHVYLNLFLVCCKKSNQSRLYESPNLSILGSLPVRFYFISIKLVYLSEKLLSKRYALFFIVLTRIRLDEFIVFVWITVMFIYDCYRVMNVGVFFPSRTPTNKFFFVNFCF